MPAMSLKLMVASQLACQVALASAELEAESLAQIVAEDTECAAAGDDEQPGCSMNALQFMAIPKSVDMDSEEGADYIEAAREFYASYVQERGASTEQGFNPSDYNTTKTEAKDGIEPPSVATEYNGISWPPLNVSAPEGGEVHFFAIGDWGGMDGELDPPPDGFPRMITYPGGETHGPHIFARTRMGCPMETINQCYFPGKGCSRSCGFAKGVDDQAQFLVANEMKKRAAKVDPAFVLNVGDNFYWGGIAKKCGFAMDEIHPATMHQFTSIFEEIYSGPGLDGKPWLSVLGNHDWGGRMFTAGWDQQIAYTWASDRWMMPAVYWHQEVQLPDYTADIYMLDTNVNDAHPSNKDLAHNICGGQYNNAEATCATAGGPASIGECVDWFHKLWNDEEAWIKERLAESTAEWQIIVTHFPCDSHPKFWRKLHEDLGLDLLVTGHRHDQELWKANGWGIKGKLGGLTCFVTGGGGGITSEESIYPGTLTHGWVNVNTQYGFFDVTMSKTKLVIESIDYKGEVLDSTTVLPKEIGS